METKTKPEYHTEGGPDEQKGTPEPLAYKPLWVHPRTHKQVKQLAEKQGLTIVALIRAWAEEEERGR